MSKHSETVRLTASFKLDGPKEVLEPIFHVYRAMVNTLLEHAHKKGITSFRRLRREKY